MTTTTHTPTPYLIDRLMSERTELVAALRLIATYDPTQWDAATLGNIARAALAKVAP